MGGQEEGPTTVTVHPEAACGIMMERSVVSNRAFLQWLCVLPRLKVRCRPHPQRGHLQDGRQETPCFVLNRRPGVEGTL
jgi:hypothetical protein